MNIITIKSEKVDVSPVLNKSMQPVKGKNQIELVFAKADVDCKIILASDLHHNSFDLLSTIETLIPDSAQYILICAGDMAGAGILGSDGDPLPAMEEAQEHFDKVFFVLGNHDIKSRYLHSLKNPGGSFCYLDNRVQEIPGLGKIAGIDGVISNKNKLNRIPKEEYIHTLKNICSHNLDWLVTHEVPAIVTSQKMGHEEITETVLETQTKNHVFGHCHLKTWQEKEKNTHFFNVDSRIICIN